VAFFVQKNIRLHIPDELMSNQLGLLTRSLYELNHVSHGIVSGRLDKLWNVEEDGVGVIIIKTADCILCCEWVTWVLTAEKRKASSWSTFGPKKNVAELKLIKLLSHEL
jgi:hypothetical protein